MNIPPPRQTVRLPIRLARIDSGLQARVVATGRGGIEARRVLVLITDGTGRVEQEDATRTLAGPALHWLARPVNSRLIIDAGTTGYLAEIGDETVARAVGDFAESAALMFMVDRDLSLSFEAHAAEPARIAESLGAILAEGERPQAGSAMLVVAHLRIVLVAMMRLSGIDEAAGGGRGEDFLPRFRQLVEGHFREHWPVGRYAQALGISQDRLHAICRRELGRGPKALIAERLAREAGLALERSSLSVEQLSDSLGFRDPAHFSHFFKRMTGSAPGRYRRLAAAGSEAGMALRSLADWP